MATATPNGHQQMGKVRLQTINFLCLLTQFSENTFWRSDVESVGGSHGLPPMIQSQSTTLQRWHPWQEYPHTCWGYDHQKMNHWDRTTGHRDTNINQWHHTASSECSKLLYIWFSLMAKLFSFTGIGQETKKTWVTKTQTHPRIWGTYFSVCTSWCTSLTS